MALACGCCFFSAIFSGRMWTSEKDRDADDRRDDQHDPGQHIGHLVEGLALEHGGVRVCRQEHGG